MAVGKIKNVLKNTDCERTAEVMGRLLMDPDTNTYKMFEDLSSSYIAGSEEFRQGLDAAVSILTNHNLSEIAEMM